MKKLTILLLFCLIARYSNAKCKCGWEYIDYATNIHYMNIGLVPNTTTIIINYGDSLNLIGWANTFCGLMLNVNWTYNGTLMTNWITTPYNTSVIVHDGGIYVSQYDLNPYGILTTLTHTFEVVCLAPCAGATSVSENNLQNILNINPNPFNDKLNIVISVNEQSSLSYAVFNMYGKKVKTFSQNKFAGELKQSENFQNLSSGIYFFQLTLDNKTIVRKLVHR